MNKRFSLRILKYLLIIFSIWFSIHTIYLVYDGMSSPKYEASVAVVFGNKVNEDGTLSERLQKRLDKGLDLYNKQLVKKIIVSGGLGKEGFYEGSVMRDYLISKNIPDSDIIIDNSGDNTEKTVVNLVTFLNGQKQIGVIAVSQYYHITRIKQLLRKQGFRQIQGASPSYFEWRDFYSIPREFIGFYVNLLEWKIF